MINPMRVTQSVVFVSYAGLSRKCSNKFGRDNIKRL